MHHASQCRGRWTGRASSTKFVNAEAKIIAEQSTTVIFGSRGRLSRSASLRLIPSMRQLFGAGILVSNIVFGLLSGRRSDTVRKNGKCVVEAVVHVY